MFLSEKIAEMQSMGATRKQVSDFTRTYNEAMETGKNNKDAMQFAEAHFGGPGSGPQVGGGNGVKEKDPSRIQEIKNSIREGEMILKSGKTATGRKMSSAELEGVKKSIESSKAKI
jgi:hypothetical protein